MATKTLSKDEILEAIGSMSVVELADLVDSFKDKFNVTVAAAPVAAAPAAGDAAAAVEEKTEFDVVLKDIGPKKIQVIKAVRMHQQHPHWFGHGKVIQYWPSTSSA